MAEKDYTSVVETLRLADGALFSMPITLDVDQQQIDQLGLKPGAKVTLRDLRDDRNLAILTIEDVYRPDRVNEAVKVFGSDDDTHPGVKYLLSTAKDFYVGGKVEAVQRLEHYDFLDLRCEFTPC
jgi:sulfate adenylyltransferase